MDPFANFAKFETPSLLSKLQGTSAMLKSNQDGKDLPKWTNSNSQPLPNRKNSLKFCRRLCRGVKNLIYLASFSDFIFQQFESLLECFNSHEIKIIDCSAFQRYHKKLLLQIWQKVTEMLSSTKNDRICLVTLKEWNSIMTLKGFEVEIGAFSDNFKEILAHVAPADSFAKEAFIGFYCQLLFVVNQIFIFTVLFEDIERDIEFHRKIVNLEDFYTMTIDPSLYRSYNHKRGKFAPECCQKCKICKSSSLLENSTHQLQQARQELQSRRLLFRVLDLNLSKVVNINNNNAFILFKIILNCS